MAAGSLACFGIAAFVYCLYGFEGTLTRDSGLYIYGAQQLVQGVPPYISILDPKGPLSFLVPALGILLADILGWDDVFGVRFVFLLISCGTASALFLLAWKLFKRRSVAFFATLTFIGFRGFAIMAAVVGPRPKSFSVLFDVLCLLAIAQRRWFWAGLCGAVAALTWQPSGILIIVVLALALFQVPEARWKALGRAVMGILLPGLLVIVWYYAADAIAGLKAGLLLGFYLEDPPMTLLARLIHIVKKGYAAYNTMFFPMLLGFGMMIVIFWGRFVESQASWRAMFRQDAFVPVFFSFLGYGLWSLYDFQGMVDYFPLLPYAALGFGVFLAAGTKAVSARWKQQKLLSRLVSPMVALVLFGVMLVDAKIVRDRGLLRQKEAVAQIEQKYGANVDIVSIGAPELMVLLHQRNPNPYLHIIRGIDNWIHKDTPGGFEAWVRQLERRRPDLIGYGPTNGRYVPLLDAWIERNYVEEQIGPWRLYVRKDLETPD